MNVTQQTIVSLTICMYNCICTAKCMCITAYVLQNESPVNVKIEGYGIFPPYTLIVLHYSSIQNAPLNFHDRARKSSLKLLKVQLCLECLTRFSIPITDDLNGKCRGNFLKISKYAFSNKILIYISLMLY